MSFRYFKVSLSGPGGSWLSSWVTTLSISGPQGHFLGHPGGPDSALIDLAGLWEPISNHFGKPWEVPLSDFEWSDSVWVQGVTALLMLLGRD